MSSLALYLAADGADPSGRTTPITRLTDRTLMLLIAERAIGDAERKASTAPEPLIKLLHERTALHLRLQLGEFLPELDNRKRRNHRRVIRNHSTQAEAAMAVHLSALDNHDLRKREAVQ